MREDMHPKPSSGVALLKLNAHCTTPVSVKISAKMQRPLIG